MIRLDYAMESHSIVNDSIRDGNSGNSGNNNTVKHRIINTPNHWRGKEQGQNKSQETNSHFRSGGSQNQGHIQTQHIGRYISKFKKQESPVEEKILNQVILNKLNKFSAANLFKIHGTSKVLKSLIFIFNYNMDRVVISFIIL